MAKYEQKEIEAEVLAFWESKRIPQRLSEQRQGAKPFFLLDGPPYANAEPHVGHVKTTSCKDIWSRYKQMQGFRSYWQPGFDCHGLPTEVMVEKELGITQKSDIEKLGIEKFDAACLAKVTATEGRWMSYYRALGAWRAYSEPYFTYKDYYIESGWWALKKMHEKGLLVQGVRPTYWCAHCETSLSGYEVSDSYKDVSDPSIYVKFKLKGAGSENKFLIVWTTTPWTLPSNVAIAAHPDEEYVEAKITGVTASGGAGTGLQGGDGEVWIVGRKRLEAVLRDKVGAKYEVLRSFAGKELDGKEYEPLLENPQQDGISEKAFRVYMSIPIMTNKKYKKHKLVIKTSEEKKQEAALEKITGTEEKEEFAEFVSLSDGTGMVHVAPGHGHTDNYLGKHYGLPALSPVNEQGKFTEEAGEFTGKFVKGADKDIVAKLDSEGKLVVSEKITHRVALCWRCKTQLIFRLSNQWYLQVEPLKETMVGENEKKLHWMPDYGKEKFHNWLVDRQDWAVSQQRYWGIPMPVWECSMCSNFEVIGSKEELTKKAIHKPTAEQLTDLHRHTVDKIDVTCSQCGSPSKRVKDILNVWYDSGIAPFASLGYPFKNKELFESMFPVDLVCESQDQIRGWFDSLMFTSVGVFGKASYKSVALMGWVLDEKGEKMSKSLGNVVPAIEGIEKLSADVIRMYYCYEIAPWEVQKFSFKTAEEVRRAYAILYNIYAFYDTYSQGEEVPPSLSHVRGFHPEDRWILSRLVTLQRKFASHMDKFEFHYAGRALLDFVVSDFSRVYVKLVRDRVSVSAEGSGKKACLAVIRHVLLEYSKLLAPISPFISEHLFQKLRGASEPESVHYCDYPHEDRRHLDEKLEQDFAVANKLTEAMNSARQEAKLKHRWPLGELFVSGDEKVKSAVESLQEVLANWNNCTKVTFVSDAPAGFVAKEFDSGKAFVPSSLDESLVGEAALREFARAVQDARKKNGFVVHDRISLEFTCSHAAISTYLESKKDAIALDVGAKKISMVGAPKGDVAFEVDLSELKPSLVVSGKFSKA